MSRFPFSAYPNSWYAVAWSRDVRPGKAIPVRYLGRDLVVFRGEDGAARVLDAYCPHMGAHLGVNGKVVGNSIQCPFHAWRFNGEGQCVEVPYAPKIPPKARVHCWPVREVNGAILVYYHERGEPPPFEVPQVPEFGSPDWQKPRNLSITVRSHVQEMNENVYDVAHFIYIHHFNWAPQVEFEENGPFARARLTGSGRIAGLPLKGDAVSSIYGAGFLASHVTRPLEMMIYVFKTPIDEEHVEHRYAVSVRRKFPGVDLLLKTVANWQVTRDVRMDGVIWGAKTHLTKPVLVKTDGPIMRFRKWHAQFYSSPVPLRTGETAETPPSVA